MGLDLRDRLSEKQSLKRVTDYKLSLYIELCVY